MNLNTAIENLKEATSKALVCALEEKNTEVVDTLINVYSTVRSISLNNEFQFSYNFNISTDIPSADFVSGLGTDYISGDSSPDVIRL